MSKASEGRDKYVQTAAMGGLCQKITRNDSREPWGNVLLERVRHQVD